MSRFLDAVAERTLEVNDRFVARCDPVGSGRFLDEGELPTWCARLAARTDDLADEVAGLQRTQGGFATLNDVTLQPSYHVGRWDVYVLVVDRRPVPAAVQSCPRTSAALRDVPRLQFAFFSIFRPGVRLDPHQDPNKATYRYLLPVQAPSGATSGIRLGDERRAFRRGSIVAFDHTVEHEAWNDAEEDRVVLFLEVGRELPFPVSLSSWVANRVFDLHPATRGARRRLSEYDAALNG